MGFQGGSHGKEPTLMQEMQETWVRSLGWEHPSSGGGHGNPPWQLQYSCLENPMDRGAWWATVYRVAKSQTPLSDLALTYIKSLTRASSIAEGTILSILFKKRI